MSDVGTTPEDLERFLAEHHLSGAGLRREGQAAWKWHHLENSMDGDTILFSIDDWPAMTKLGFYRKEEAAV